MVTRRDFLKAFLAAAGSSLLFNQDALATILTKEALPLPGNPHIQGMLKRAIPKTGEKIPAMALGTYRAFDVGTAKAVRSPRLEVLDIFFKAGGELIDTAPSYGQAEIVIGDLLSELQPQAKPFIATKVSSRGRENGIRQIEESFKKLRVDKIDLMQVHSMMDWKTQLPLIQEMKAQGKLRYIGITHHSENAFEAQENIMRNADLDFVQLVYSLEKRGAHDRILPLAQDKGIAILANRNFAAGRMFKKVRGIELPQWAVEFGAKTWAQFFLKYALSHPVITCVIPATANPKHMMDNMQAGFGPLPDQKQRKQMEDYWDNL